MPDLLIELFSEEIPARMQRRAAEDLKKLVTDALVEAGLVYEGARALPTPRGAGPGGTRRATFTSRSSTTPVARPRKRSRRSYRRSSATFRGPRRCGGGRP